MNWRVVFKGWYALHQTDVEHVLQYVASPCQAEATSPSEVDSLYFQTLRTCFEDIYYKYQAQLMLPLSPNTSM